MALTLISASGYSHGVTSDETAVNIESFKCTVEPEFIDHLMGKTNEVRGSAVAPMKLSVEMAFEIGGSTGIMAAVPTTAFSPVNSTAYFGAPVTGLYLTKGEVDST